MRNRQISIAQAKAEFAALIARAEAGGSTVITRNGRPVARLIGLVTTPVVYGDLSDLPIPSNLSAFELADDVVADFEGRDF